VSHDHGVLANTPAHRASGRSFVFWAVCITARAELSVVTVTDRQSAAAAAAMTDGDIRGALHV
jgi:hypothetical protein